MEIQFKIHISGVRAQARLKPIVQASKRNDNRNFPLRIGGYPQIQRQEKESSLRADLVSEEVESNLTVRDRNNNSITSAWPVTNHVPLVAKQDIFSLPAMFTKDNVNLWTKDGRSWERIEDAGNS